MGTFKITGLGAGTAATDAAQFGQLQAGATQIATVTGTDTIAGTLSPALGAYATGNLFSFVAANTNTGAATINLNSLGAKSITKLGSTALAAGDIVSGRVYLIEYDGTRFQLINPSASSVSSFSAGSTGLTPSSATTGAVTLAGTLATTNGGTGLTSFTSGGVVYASSTSALATGSALVFDGTNLGIGTSSPASGGGGGLTLGTTSSGKSFHVYSSSYASNGLGNFYGTDGNMKLQIGALSATSAYVYANTGCSLVLYSGGNTSATLDSSGNLGLGVTPSAWGSGPKVMQMGSSGAYIFGDSVSLQVGNNSYFNGTNYIYKNTAAASDYYQFQGSHVWRNAPSGTAGNAITFTQAATLDASGNFLVGRTSQLYGERLNVTNGGSTTNTATFYFNTSDDRAAVIIRHDGATGATARKQIAFLAGASEVGYIASTGSATVYSTASDYRLKNTVAPMTGALAKVAALKPVTYKWNTNGSDGEGFIAHELAEVCPHAVVGAKDAVDTEGKPQYQGIDTSFLVATLTAAIQELNAKFEEYKAAHP